MPTRQTLTIWIDNNADPGNPDPPLVIEAGLNVEYISREDQGSLQVVGPTAPGAMQIGQGSSNFFIYNIDGIVSEDGAAILQRINTRQAQQGPPINFRDQTERVDTIRIDGVGSRQQLDTLTYTDSLKSLSGGAINVAHFESIGVLEIQDQPQRLEGPASDGEVKYTVAFRVFEIV